MKKKLNPIQSKILIALIKNGDFMTTAQVAKDSEISWNTALNYLNIFYEWEWVEKAGDVTIYWRAILQE